MGDVFGLTAAAAVAPVIGDRVPFDKFQPRTEMVMNHGLLFAAELSFVRQDPFGDSSWDGLNGSYA